MNKREATVAFIEIFKCHFLLHRFLFFLSDTILADEASKQQKTVLFFYPLQSHAQGETRTDKTVRLDGKSVLCKRTFSSGFSANFLHN
jgi:hypothetical protein